MSLMSPPRHFLLTEFNLGHRYYTAAPEFYFCVEIYSIDHKLQPVVAVLLSLIGYISHLAQLL